MDGDTELFITLPIATISILFTVWNMIITMFLLWSFFGHHCKRVEVQIEEKDKTKQRDAHSNNNQQTESMDVAPYFKYTALITVIFNTLCSFFNSAFSVYLVIDPQFDDTIWYTHHPSHIYRILSTICWYIAQVSLIYVFTGRLYYTFHTSPYRVNEKCFICINIFNTITVFSGLICGYYGVFVGNLILAEIGLNIISRVLYEIISFIVLYMFSSRLLILTIRNRSASSMDIKETKIATIPSESMKSATELATQSLPSKVPSKIPVPSSSIASIQKPLQLGDKKLFLTVTTRNAILMLTVSFSVLMVTVCFFGFRFLFGPQTRLTLLIPMNMAAFDTVNTSICVLCCFRYGKSVYYKLCGACDGGCKRICLRIARKYY